MLTREQKRNIRRQFTRYAIKYEVFKRETNEFKEVIGDILVTEIKGFIHTNTTKTNTYKTDKKGITTNTKMLSLTVLDITDIQKHMYIYVKGERYEIIDIINEAELDFTYILKLREADSND